MRRDLGHRLAAGALFMALTAGCSNAVGDIGSRAVASTASPRSPDAPGTPVPPATGGTLGGGVEAFRNLAPQAPQLGPDVHAFIDQAPAERLDELATHSCAEVRPRMTDRELGLRAFDGYHRLSSTEQERLSERDWTVLFGALVGYFCPQNLPGPTLDIDLDASDDDIASYRRLLQDLDGVSPRSRAFMDRSADERIDGLRDVACDTASATHDSAQEFGSAIIESYEVDLTVAERDTLTIDEYGELFGSLVGWFCPGRMPR